VRTLLILRHAKSSWAQAGQDDWQRPLNDRGLRDAPAVGEWLREQSLVPDLIITSDAVRARTTAQAVAAASGYKGELVVEPSLYLATPDDAIAVLSGVADDARSVMIVGHNPGLEDLVAQLTDEHHGMPTAAIVHLTVPIARWSELDGTTAASILDTWQPRDRSD
jgi:phosphohistidine phosphatase